MSDPRGHEDHGMRGLPAVGINVSHIDDLPDGEGHETFRRKVFQIVEGMLTEAGIAVLPSAEGIILAKDVASYLDLSFALSASEKTSQGEFVALAVDASLMQAVTLRRTGETRMSPTWNNAAIGINRKRHLRGVLEEGVRGCVTAFITAYREAQRDGDHPARTP